MEAVAVKTKNEKIDKKKSKVKENNWKSKSRKVFEVDDDIPEPFAPPEDEVNQVIKSKDSTENECKYELSNTPTSTSGNCQSQVKNQVQTSTSESVLIIPSAPPSPETISSLVSQPPSIINNRYTDIKENQDIPNVDDSESAFSEEVKRFQAAVLRIQNEKKRKEEQKAKGVIQRLMEWAGMKDFTTTTHRNKLKKNIKRNSEVKLKVKSALANVEKNVSLPKDHPYTLKVKELREPSKEIQEEIIHLSSQLYICRNTGELLPVENLKEVFKGLTALDKTSTDLCTFTLLELPGLQLSRPFNELSTDNYRREEIRKNILKILKKITWLDGMRRLERELQLNFDICQVFERPYPKNYKIFGMKPFRKIFSELTFRFERMKKMGGVPCDIIMTFEEGLQKMKSIMKSKDLNDNDLDFSASEEFLNSEADTSNKKMKEHIPLPYTWEYLTKLITFESEKQEPPSSTSQSLPPEGEAGCRSVRRVTRLGLTKDSLEGLNERMSHNVSSNEAINNYWFQLANPKNRNRHRKWFSFPMDASRRGRCRLRQIDEEEREIQPSTTLQNVTAEIRYWTRRKSLQIQRVKDNIIKLFNKR